MFHPTSGRLLPLSENRRKDLDQAEYDLDGVDVQLYIAHPMFGLWHAGDVQDAEEAIARMDDERWPEEVIMFYAPHGKWFYTRAAHNGAVRQGE